MSTDWTPITLQTCGQEQGPFYHGTKARLSIGEHLTTGYQSHFEESRVLKHIYFSSLIEPAIWGAELAMLMSGLHGRGQIYMVEPTGPFEDDPNLTNKRFPGNPTKSYRTTHQLKIVGFFNSWEGHPTDVLQAMLESLADLKRRGENRIVD